MFCRSLVRGAARPHPLLPRSLGARRAFSASIQAQVIKPFLLADIGEGIRECEVIQWFVEPNARVQQFDKLCEVQSDKASVEITSRFDGVIRKLHYDAGEMAIVGKPLVDIDIDEEAAQAEPEAIGEAAATEPAPASTQPAVQAREEPVAEHSAASAERETANEARRERHKALATPAVRHLSQELDIDITIVRGTGKDGRVLKEDLHRHAQEQSSSAPAAPIVSAARQPTPSHDETVPLSKVQLQMFKSMTRSLQIPHFLYSDEADFTSLSRLRDLLNADQIKIGGRKLSYMPFILKATSLALRDYPMLNATLNSSDPANLSLTYRSNHNLSIAIDSPAGLVVPVINAVQDLTIPEIQEEIVRLQAAASSSSLKPNDFGGGTFTISNIGSIGGTYVSPLIVEGQLGILGLGQVRELPRFGSNGEVERRKIGIMSWCGDHRVIDGATMARFAELVRSYVEHPERMLRGLK